MKTLSIITVLLCCSLVLQKEVHAGKTSGVMYSVYKQSFSDPITFDTYIAQNKNLFDAEYFACTDRLLLKYAGRAKELADCRGYADAQMQQRCMAQNVEAQFYDWLLSMVAAVKNGAPWCKTSAGSFSCWIKASSDGVADVYESLFPGLMEQIAREAEPLNRLYLKCD